jgi:hypothetical protein
VLINLAEVQVVIEPQPVAWPENEAGELRSKDLSFFFLFWRNTHYQ